MTPPELGHAPCTRRARLRLRSYVDVRAPVAVRAGQLLGAVRAVGSRAVFVTVDGLAPGLRPGWRIAPSTLIAPLIPVYAAGPRRRTDRRWVGDLGEDGMNRIHA